MKREDKKLILAVVGNIVVQYISRLKEHKALAEEKFTAKSSYGYACNVEKCSKGITYAERILANLPEVLFRNKEWTRKELNAVFHNKEYDADTVSLEWGETSDETMISRNIINVLETLGGMRASEILSSLIGYAVKRSEKEFVDGERWVKGVEGGSFGKIGVNYGKTRDFDVLFGTDKTDLEIDFSSPYMIIRRSLMSRTRGVRSRKSTTERAIKGVLKDFTFGVYPRNYGSVVRTCDPCADYQRKFGEFRSECFERERFIKLQEEMMSELEDLDMII